MKNNYLWTSLKARLQLIATTSGAFNWLFLPGGPGLGSESLVPLTQLLKLPGRIWHLDLPGDGSNLTEDDSKFFSKWSEALREVVSALDDIILVAHSTGGMYALATEDLEKSLTGLVLMDSAPDASWQQHFMRHVKRHPIPEVEILHKIYTKNPDNEILKNLTLLSAPYLFTKEGLSKDISFLESLPYNFRTCDWSARYFDTTYKAKWIPKNIPTLILAGEEDFITPISLFMESKEFQNPNILIKTIKNAAHFPWIENPNEVSRAFTEYFQELLKSFVQPLAG
ncbi:MAG: alpha/beta hydrolase [Tatlockia sp.]|nr:alpha/beta hydrolase [Tatlockia sp.]